MAPEFKREPDFEQFLKVLRRKGTPSHLPFYEHIASSGFIARRTGRPFDRMSMDDPGYWETYCDFWLGMGYDCIPMEIALDCPLPELDPQGGHSRASESHVVIRTMEEFEKYPWPDVSKPLDFRHFERVAALLPAGARIVGGVCMGPYEWAWQMMGVVGMSYAIVDRPELVDAVFERLGVLHVSALRTIASMEGVGALRQGDDLGFKTSTFLSPEQLRRWVFPTYRRMVDEAHGAGKPFILHSCGDLSEVYEDIFDCGIDAKHSFEDVILPVAEFKRLYGARVTPLGGLDVDVICRSGEDELRRYTRKAVEECFSDGYWTLGTGNSLTDYMPVENYLIALDEGTRATGG